MAMRDILFSAAASFTVMAAGLLASCGTPSKAAMMPVIGNVEAIHTSSADEVAYPLFRNKPRKAFDDLVLERLEYPYAAEREGITGIVEATFIVDTDGSISAVSIVRSPAEPLSKEVLKVISRSPKKWTPATLNGMPVRTLMKIAVEFGKEGAMVISINEEDRIVK